MLLSIGGEAIVPVDINELLVEKVIGASGTEHCTVPPYVSENQAQRRDAASG